MFITVTRFGGSSALRLAAAAVAHITPVDDGAVLHLLSGEHLRVNEAADQVERMVCDTLAPTVLQIRQRLDDEIRAMGQDFRAVLAYASGFAGAAIDEDKEGQALDVAVRAGQIDGVQATEQRCEQVVRRNRGRRA